MPQKSANSGTLSPAIPPHRRGKLTIQTCKISNQANLYHRMWTAFTMRRIDGAHAVY